jgi:hypothetical protein
MMRYRVLVAVAAGASSVLVGCGGGEADSTQVSSVAHRYFVALGSGNGSELCSLLTGESKQRLIRSGALFITHRSKTLGCPEVAKVVHLVMGSDQAAEARKVKVSVHTLSGNNASVRVTFPKGRSVLLPMTKTAAGWLIELGSSVPGSGG